MVEQNTTPAAIHGDRILITGQKIFLSGRPIKLIDEVVYPINVKERGNAIIIKECAKKEPQIKEYSMRNKDDKISGKILWGYTTTLLGRDDITIGGAGRTSSHPGQQLDVTGGCFMEIVSGWCGTPLAEHPKDALLS
ncbi:MAG: hypothetical protein ABSC19_05995 [Syntrophorhabdales bacterium]|jgi:hypothetical protein